MDWFLDEVTFFLLFPSKLFGIICLSDFDFFNQKPVQNLKTRCIMVEGRRLCILKRRSVPFTCSYYGNYHQQSLFVKSLWRQFVRKKSIPSIFDEQTFEHSTKQEVIKFFKNVQPCIICILCKSTAPQYTAGVQNNIYTFFICYTYREKWFLWSKYTACGSLMQFYKSDLQD